MTPIREDAARREMIEESGYDSEDIIELGRVHPNPAIQANYCYSYLARDVHKVPKPISTGARRDASRAGAAARNPQDDRI